MNEKNDLYKIHTEGETKYVYFLLASAGAALGYALQQLEGVTISCWSSPAILALLSWLLSFFFGCTRIQTSHRLISANYSLLQLKDGIHPQQPDHPVITDAAIKGATQAAEKAVSDASRHFSLQFGFLIAGGLLFLVYRVADMFRVTFPS